MALKNILVHIDHTNAVSARLALAVSLAAAHEAALTGLYVVPASEMPGYLRAQLGPEFMQQQEDLSQRFAAEAEAQFREAAAARGITPDWRSYKGDAANLVSLNARYFDLVVLGQADPEDEQAASTADLPERVVLAAGRPVLVVPYAGSFAGVGDRVIVAWNGSRESARAVNDALPLLRRAKAVTVLTVEPESSDRGTAAAADVCRHLALHGVNALAEHVHADDMNAGDMLLSRAGDLGADLLVMGAYGQSRLRELVLGGVTRHVVRHMTVPVLMAH